MAKFCVKCGKELEDDYAFCPDCGTSCNVNSFNNESNQNAQSANQTNSNGGCEYQKPKKKIDKWVAFLLCFFAGGVGAHKFYEGKIGMGIAYLFTGAFFGIGWIVDIIAILDKPDVYYV